jgi:hypothetical protein
MPSEQPKTYKLLTTSKIGGMSFSDRIDLKKATLQLNEACNNPELINVTLIHAVGDNTEWDAPWEVIVNHVLVGPGKTA